MIPELGKLTNRKIRLKIATIKLQILQQHIAQRGQHGLAQIIVKPIERKTIAGISTQADITSGFILLNISSGVYSYFSIEPITGILDTESFSFTKKFSPITPHQISEHSLL